MNREEEQALFKLVEASKESHGENARETLIALWKLASFYEQHNELDAAYQILMKRYQICLGTYEQSYFDKANCMTLSCIQSLAVFEEEMKHDLIEAEKWFQLAISLCKQHLVPYHQSTSSMTYYLAKFYLRHGNREKEAEALYLQVFATCQRTAGENTEFTLDAMKELVSFYEERGKIEECQEWQNKVDRLKWLV